MIKDINEMWKLHKNHKTLKDVQIKTSFLNSFGISFLCTIGAYIYTNSFLITFWISLGSLFCSLLFYLFTIEHFPCFYNNKIKKKLEKKGCLNYFDKKAIYGKKELKELIIEIESASEESKSLFPIILSGSDYNSMENLEKHLVVYKYKIQKDKSVSYLENYIKDVNKTFNVDDASYISFLTLKEKIHETKNKEIFFNEKSKVIKLIKDNVRNITQKEELVDMISSYVASNNKEKEVNEKLDKLDNIKIINFKKNKTKENFVLKQV